MTYIKLKDDVPFKTLKKYGFKKYYWRYIKQVGNFEISVSMDKLDDDYRSIGICQNKCNLRITADYQLGTIGDLFKDKLIDLEECGCELHK